MQKQDEQFKSDEFKADLEKLFEPVNSIPANIDNSILFKAHKHFKRSMTRKIIRWIGSSAAAAVIIIAVIFFTNDQISVHSVIAGDFDSNGKVDILDAFKLSKVIKSGTIVQSKYDYNSDGKVDESDADRIAKIAVSLDKGAKL